MVVLNYTGEEINAKIVYYGPGLSGKTTNLKNIYQRMPADAKGKMVSMKTRTDRTLFFDFLPLDLGEIGGYRARFLLYTVPGQVYYNATRKLVLKGADAVVFVADSGRDKLQENIESLRNLEENLNEHGLSLDDLPWVIQYNKRDAADAMTVAELDENLNLLDVPAFEAVATDGTGVYETFQGIAHLLYVQLKERLENGESVARISGAEDPADPATAAMTAAGASPEPGPAPVSAGEPVAPAETPPARTEAPAAPVTSSAPPTPAESSTPSPSPMPRPAPPPEAPATPDGTADEEDYGFSLDTVLREVDPAGSVEDAPAEGPAPETSPRPAAPEPPAKAPVADAAPATPTPHAAPPVAPEHDNVDETAPAASESNESGEFSRRFRRAHEAPADAPPPPDAEEEFAFEDLASHSHDTSPIAPADQRANVPMRDVDTVVQSGAIAVDEAAAEFEVDLEDDAFITDPARSTRPAEKTAAEDAPPVSKPLDGDETIVQVPVLLSRSQVRKSVSLKLMLEIRVIDD